VTIASAYRPKRCVMSVELAGRPLSPDLTLVCGHDFSFLKPCVSRRWFVFLGASVRRLCDHSNPQLFKGDVEIPSGELDLQLIQNPQLDQDVRLKEQRILNYRPV
jgi:hypothetical protein